MIYEMQDVLNLPREKQEEFAKLLGQTSLAAIINASRTVADRLAFLRGLEILVYNPQSRKEILERRHLHKILENEVWLFGEAFQLSASDQSLTEVLRKHLALLGRKPAELAPVLLPGDKRSRIVDIMLSRAIFQPDTEEREHLIIELKRPKQPIDDKVQTQIERYAFAVANDERFKNTKTKWTFWAISNQITPGVQLKVKREGKPEGQLFDEAGGRTMIWLKTWAQVIEPARARLEFFRQQLEYKQDDQFALDYLHKLYERYLPPSLSD